MDNRIDHRFLQLQKQGRSGFMAYITGGDPTLERTVDIAIALSTAGVDFLEIGIPFSDPLADGVANQLGAQRALAAGTTVPSRGPMAGGPPHATYPFSESDAVMPQRALL